MTKEEFAEKWMVIYSDSEDYDILKQMMVNDLNELKESFCFKNDRNKTIEKCQEQCKQCNEWQSILENK